MSASTWRARLELAVQLLIGLFIALMISDKWREGASGAAVAALVCAVVLARISPPAPGVARMFGAFAFAGAAFVALNLASWLLAPEMPRRGDFRPDTMRGTGVAIALAAGLGLRGAVAVRRMVGWLLIAAAAWYALDAATLWLPARAHRHPPFQGGGEHRLQGFRDYPNTYSGELVIMAALFLGWALADRDRRTMLLALLAAGLTTALLLMTKVRAALLAGATAALPAAAFFAERLGGLRRRLVLVAVWFLVLLPAAGAVWYGLASPGRRSLETVDSRLRAYRIGAQIAARAPWPRKIIGFGPSSRVFAAAADYCGAEAPEDIHRRFIHAHNNLLQILVETGVLGVLAVLGLWLTAFLSAWRAWRGGSALAGILLPALLTMIAAGLANYSLWQVVGNLSWLVTGLTFAGGACVSAGAAGAEAPAAAEVPAP